MASYIDFRYPVVNLNQTPRLPSNFGPPNMASMFQSGISGLADPIVAGLERMRQQNLANETRKDILGAYKSGGTATTTPPADPSTEGSPGGDDTAGTMGGGASARASPEVRDSFLNRVKSAPDGVTNPYGLAAVAATGQSESGWSSGNVNRIWPDKGKPSGGLMSWRAGRLQNMLASTRGAEDPVTAQADFFLKENPQLIAALNAARSPEEANALMARAWRYEGFDGGPEFAKREALTRQYAAQFGDAAPAPTSAVAAAPQAPTPSPEEQAVARVGTPAPPPPPAPQASFAPPVAPAPTPQAAAATAAPQGPQQQAPTPQEQQLQQQARVIQDAEQDDQATAARLAAERQVGQTRVASLDPSVGISPALPALDLGSTIPNQTARAAPPPIVPPPTPAPAASAPTAPAGPQEPPVTPAGVPTPAPAPAPEPVRVAQAGGGVPRPQQRVIAPVDPVAERMLLGMLNRATTQEEVLRIGQELLKLRQGSKPTVHSTPEGLYEYDPNTRTGKLLGAGGRPAPTVEVEIGGGKQRFQWNERTRRYDIPVGSGGGPASTQPSKEVREGERQLFNDFEGTETVKKYRELEQGVQGLHGAFKSGNAAADLVAVIQLFKAIDPGSTVTATEGASIRNAAGVPETLRALFNKGVGEGGQFSPALRAEIFNTAQRLQQNRVLQVEKHAQTYRNRAKAYGFDPDRTVAFEPFKFEKATPEDFPDNSRREVTGTGPPRRGSREAPIVMPDEASAKKLPIGTVVRIPGKRNLFGPNEPDRLFEVTE